jgi:hypothetical protein
MAMAKLSKVHFNKSMSTIEFATENYLLDFLKILKAESHLPINQMLIMLFDKEADTVSCSRDDTNYSFFASQNRDVISVIVKKIGEETIEFDIPRNKLDKIKPLPQL